MLQIILLLEKRVLRIIYKIVLGIIPTGIYWLVTRACPMVSESASQGSPISVLLKEWSVVLFRWCTIILFLYLLECY